MMFGFVKRVIGEMRVAIGKVAIAIGRFVAIVHQECKVSPQIVTINSNEPLYYPFSISVNRSSGICNNINDPDARLCVSDIIKDMNIEVFNLTPTVNEPRYIC